ncbi:hypothetical protein LIER_37710 [Lithospermum erythrorhizon]|uniref:Uncharacterized protein n=1 Tax=Lithospermum erythrorhizon TaxID=34254 RepID=A0AAV3PQX9_LITER
MPLTPEMTAHTPDSYQTLFPLNGFEEGQTPIPSAGYEPGQGNYPARQAPCFLIGSQTLLGLYCRYLVRVRLNTLLADHIGEELSGGHPKDALIGVEPKLIPPQFIKALPEIVLMIRRFLALD